MNEEFRETVARLARQVVQEALAQAEAGGSEPVAPVAGRRLLMAANWKMNKLSAEAKEYLIQLNLPKDLLAEVVVFPPLSLLHLLREALERDGPIGLGAQNLHPEKSGAFTGEHSPLMLKDAGARYVIIGHSERRQLFAEDDTWIAKKVGAALAAGLRPVLCVGERFEERRQGATFRVLRNQLLLGLHQLGAPLPDPGELVVAYEPVWAIGTGQHATPQQAQEAMAFIRDCLSERGSRTWAGRVRILYGGSANIGNVETLAALADLDGFLVGGASLDAEGFSKMTQLAARVKSGQGKSR